MKFASLCLLSFERPNFLSKSFRSLINTDAGFPYELIIHDDGSEDEVVHEYLNSEYYQRNSSWVIKNNGKNMGIGKSMHNCLGIASGDYIFKLDADLEYFDGWLKTAINMLEAPQVGCVGLFDYNHYDPLDNRFNHLEEFEDYYIVDDFVASAYGFTRETYNQFGGQLGDDGWQVILRDKGMKLAIPKVDVVHNFGFGAENSVFVKDGLPRGKSDQPKIFGI